MVSQNSSAQGHNRPCLPMSGLTNPATPAVNAREAPFQTGLGRRSSLAQFTLMCETRSMKLSEGIGKDGEYVLA